MIVRFHPLTQEAHAFPQAKVPMLPVMNVDMFLGTRTPETPSRFTKPMALFLKSGSVALAHALQAAGVGKGDAVLIPAYHCVAMVEPALWLQAKVVFYKLKPNLCVDLQDIANKVDSQVKALILPHYFGFPQPLVALRHFCNAHGVKLIEDCAHAFFGETEGHVLGNVGDFAIASTRKFFPGMDGGMLCTNGHPLEHLDVRSQGPIKQLKAFAHSIEIAAAYRRLRLLGFLLRMGLRVIHKFRRQRFGSEMARYELDDGAENISHSRWFHSETLGQAGSLASLWLLRLSNKAAVARRRREHYEYLLERLRHVPHARPLFPELPKGVVPYVFPLMIERPERDFSALKARGVPIWRWEELAESDCQVSQQYRLRLLQLPCHQALRRRELDWMIATVIEVLTTKSSAQYDLSYS